MGARHVNKPLYDDLVRGFRQAPANFSWAAAAAGVSAMTAKKAWTTGWPERGLWGRPIRDVLDDEAKSARAVLALQAFEAKREQDESVAREREIAARQAVMARAEEGHMVQLSRSSAIGLLDTCTEGGAEARRKTLRVRGVHPKSEISVERQCPEW